MLGKFLSVDPVTVDTVTGWNFCRYCYAANNPYKFKDPDGRIIDTIADIAFIAYDVYALATDPSWTNAGALGADVVGAVVPFATGLGAGVRAAAHADDVVDVAKGVDKAIDTGKSGRGANNLKPDSRATGDHSTLKRDSDGNTTHTATYTANSKNPSGFQETKRVDVTGKAHRNPDGTVVPTPHVKEAGQKGVRPAREDELPRQ